VEEYANQRESRWKAELLATCFRAGFSFGLFFDPEDGDDIFIRNVGWLLTDYRMLYARRQNSSVMSFSEP
jgi:hypothetical protein